MPRKFWLIVLSSVLLAAPIAPAQSDNREATVVVNVWAAERDSTVSAQAAEAVLSRDFAASALRVAAKIRNWQLHLAYALKSGYPLSAYWIASDRGQAADALQLAVFAAKGKADRAALVQLGNLFGNVQSWSDARLEDERNLRLANYRMSASALDNDESFQNTVSCTNSLMSMLANGRLAEETTCR
jgi:hypothetical protein